MRNGEKTKIFEKEIKTLAYGKGTTKGVDADVADTVTEESLKTAIDFVKEFAKESGSIIAVTGAIDLVSDGDTCYVIRNGRPEMERLQAPAASYPA